jgi:hypothetical protein
MFVAFTLLGVSVATAPLAAGPWSWLDKPEEQRWGQVTINGYGRTIEFSVPDKAGKGGNHLIRMPALKKGDRDQIINVSSEFEKNPGKRVAAFEWERYWGGFFKKDVADFTFNVFISYLGEDTNLLNLNVEGRIKRVEDYFHGRFSSERNHDWFFERFRIEPYESAQNYVWTLENSPTVVKEQDFFRLPLTQDHELVFWFYYRWEVQGGKGDPAWLERRRELSRKILDTVRITPNPFELSLD